MKRLSVLLLAFLFVGALNAKERIVVLDPAVVENMYAIGAQDNIVAIATSEFSEIHPKELTSKLPSVGTLLKPSIEQIVYYKPTIVIINYNNDDIVAKLKDLNIKVIKFPNNSIQDIFNSIEELGRITNTKKQATKVIEERKKQLQNIKNKGPLGLKGVFLYSANPVMGFAEDTIPGEIMKILGINNIVKNVPVGRGGQLIITPELLVTNDPDFIVGTAGVRRLEDISGNPQLKNTTAFKNNHVYIISSSKILRGSIFLIDEIDALYTQFSKLKKN